MKGSRGATAPLSGRTDEVPFGWGFDCAGHFLLMGTQQSRNGNGYYYSGYWYFLVMGRQQSRNDNGHSCNGYFLVMGTQVMGTSW